MSKLIVTAGPFKFDAKFELEAAPKTCAAFKKQMPFISKMVHVRWSGEGVWMPLGDLDFGVGYENNTAYPAPATSSCIRAASARPRSCSPMAACSSPARPACSRATISSP